MTTTSPLIDNPIPGFTELATPLKAAGDSLRLEILRALARDSYGVMELAKIFDLKQSGMSHHLKVLATAGLVNTRREGNSIFYRRALPAGPYSELLNAIYVSVDAEVLSPAVKARLEQVHLERDQASQQFFTHNATKFREQQDLIASYPVYAEAVIELLANTPLPSHHNALEVGPGEGDFLSVLSHHFANVVALDNAKLMLDKAQLLAAEEGLANIEFLYGDTGLARQTLINVDCVVINMVLHHVPSPASIFEDISCVLRPGGALLVTDLCHHDQHWARDACGDQWLGFEPDDFSAWAQAAGLVEGQSQYMALRNGFQIQLRQFFKPGVQARPLSGA